ncbi:DinB family protein [Maribacter algarum]|uniref:DinB family protein n=1 Tax=Maribacter algarum (ex Zhang et al. 2020) TaxID=2578118 RepID=A0A5S3Q5R7_9FLAO|nr:DinB family protein [Maribacter algarum]TMM52111.1 DinB family protein [Maribacter algarum]
MTIKDLNENEFDPYYGRYIHKLSEHIELTEGFQNGKTKVFQFFNSMPENKLSHRYASGKWSIKEILQHLVDTERIFMYRCFRIARNDKTPLAGFDQNIYMSPSGADNKPIDLLLNEFTATRYASIALLDSLSAEDLNCIGKSNGGAMSARAAAFTIIGHDIWHMDTIKEKYL